MKVALAISLIAIVIAGSMAFWHYRASARPIASAIAPLSNGSLQDARADFVETKMDSFGYKTSWIALKAKNSSQIADVLKLSDTKPMEWNDGVALGYAPPEARAGRVFVSGLVDGWYFLRGGIPDPTDNLESFNRFMIELAAVSPDVQYFISHRVSDGYGWVRYRGGKLARRVIWYNGEAQLESGRPDDVESRVVKSWKTFDDGDGPYTLGPDEDDVLKIAKGWSLDPSSFDRPKASAPIGLVGTWAAQH